MLFRNWVDVISITISTNDPCLTGKILHAIKIRNQMLRNIFVRSTIHRFLSCNVALNFFISLQAGEAYPCGVLRCTKCKAAKSCQRKQRHVRYDWNILMHRWYRTSKNALMRLCMAFPFFTSKGGSCRGDDLVSRHQPPSSCR